MIVKLREVDIKMIGVVRRITRNMDDSCLTDQASNPDVEYHLEKSIAFQNR